MGLDEENSHFVDRMTEDNRNNLSEIDGLTLTSRVLSEQYRDSELYVTEVAEELIASYLQKGTIQKSESKVKIYAQLIDPEKDMQWDQIMTVWEDWFDKIGVKDYTLIKQCAITKELEQIKEVLQES